MKKDAREFAHLIKAFKGGAEYMWCNFDQVHLIAIYAECAAIEDELQREINATSNKVDGSGNASFSNLEDCPITPEEQAEFDRKFAELQATNPSKKLK